MTEQLPALTFLGHSTVLLEIGGRRVLTDPVLRQRVTFLTRHAVPLPRSYFADIDLVLISHLHHDHCDLPSLRMLGLDVPILAPAGSAIWLRSKGFSNVCELVVGETYIDGTLTVRAVAAVHDGKREPFGPHAAAIGFVLDAGPACVYFAGDTDIYPAMADFADEVDVALLPVWGWGPNLGAGHLDPARAAQAAAIIRPRFAVPVHWGTLYPFGMRRALPGRLYDPPHAFAAAVAALDLPVTVLHTTPGERVSFTP